MISYQENQVNQICLINELELKMLTATRVVF